MGTIGFLEEDATVIQGIELRCPEFGNRTMSEANQHDRHFPVRFTIAQRIVVAELLPELSERMRLDETDQRVVALTVDEMKEICKRVAHGHSPG